MKGPIPNYNKNREMRMNSLFLYSYVSGIIYLQIDALRDWTPNRLAHSFQSVPN